MLGWAIFWVSMWDRGKVWATSLFAYYPIVYCWCPHYQAWWNIALFLVLRSCIVLLSNIFLWIQPLSMFFHQHLNICGFEGALIYPSNLSHVWNLGSLLPFSETRPDMVRTKGDGGAARTVASKVKFLKLPNWNFIIVCRRLVRLWVEEEVQEQQAGQLLQLVVVPVLQV